MLALLAVMALTDGSPLPSPFLSTQLAPILPIAFLKDRPRVSVTKGTSWRVGGYTRLNYYFRYPLGEGPTLDDVLKEPGFRLQNARMSIASTQRAVRDIKGIMQIVWMEDLPANKEWPWANVQGPGRIICVSEFPYAEKPAAGWHQIAQLKKPPLPPGYPSHLKMVEMSKIVGIRLDPTIPRNPRLMCSNWVTLSFPGTADEFKKIADAELKTDQWQRVHRGRLLRYETPSDSYGLVRVETLHEQPDPNRIQFQLTYRFKERIYAPRLD